MFTLSKFFNKIRILINESRKKSKKIELKGMFEGAKVVRETYWQNNQKKEYESLVNNVNNQKCFGKVLKIIVNF